MTWDCIVVGGGAAGLSAALALGRARRRTLVVDAGRQSNLAADHIGGLLGADQRPAPAFYAAGRAELAAYPAVTVRDGEVVDAGREDDELVLRLADGATERTRRVVLATGMDYVVPALPGAAERWGRTVVHCPFCHGWELRERPLGVLVGSAAELERALMLRAWSDDVTVLTHGAALETAGRGRLAAAGVGLDEREVAALEGPAPELEAVRFADGATIPLGGLLVHTPLAPRSDLAARLGAETAASPMSPDGLVVDALGATTAPGVSGAGDVTGGPPSVAAAVAGGAFAGAMVVRSLMADATPVAA